MVRIARIGGDVDRAGVFVHVQGTRPVLAAIAGEKAGVLRRGRATVLGPLPPEARAAVLRRARGLRVRLVDAQAGCMMATRGERLDLRTPRAAP